MRISYEKTHSGRYQARMNGTFLCYVNERSRKEVNRRVKELGWDSVMELYDETIKMHLISLGVKK